MDISGSVVNLMQRRLTQRNVSDAYNVPPTLAGSLEVRHTCDTHARLTHLARNKCNRQQL